MIFIVIMLILNSVAFCTSDSLVNYYPNGKVESIIYLNRGILDGAAVFYYENGNIKRKATYVNGIIDGTVREYSEQGTIKESYLIVDGKRDGRTSYFDENGVYVQDRNFVQGKLQQVIDQRSAPPLPPSKPKKIKKNEPPEIPLSELPLLVQEEKKKETNEYGLPVEVNINNPENDTTFFSEVEVMPAPVIGWDAFYEKLVYPELAKKKGIEGTVILRTFITRYGDVERTEVIQGLPYGCMDTAEILTYYSKFKPGMLKGKKVNVRMEISFTFSKKE